MAGWITFLIVVGFVYWCYENIVKWLDNNKSTPTLQNEKDFTATKTTNDYAVATRDIDIELLDAKNLPTIQRCLANDADINAIDSYGYNVLNKAIKRGDLDSVKYLIANGMDINKKFYIRGIRGIANYATYTALMLSIDVLSYGNSRYGMVEFILNNSKNINFINEYDHSALSFAVLTRRIELVKDLVERGADVNASKAIVFASGAGNMEIIKYLISQGADVNARFKDGRNVLLQAVFLADFNGWEAVQYWVQYGIDINSKNCEGLTALMYIQQPKSLVSEDYYDDKVKYFIKKGLDIDTQTKDGLTALMCALSQSRRDGYNNIDLAISLIKMGANIHLKDNNGRTALMYAVSRDYPKYYIDETTIPALLIENGAYVNDKDKNGKSVLMYANGSSIKDILRKAGARE